MTQALYLIDTMYLLFKSFYALGKRASLTSPDGLPTGALYGLRKSLDTMRQHFPMRYGVCVFDSEKPVFRCQLSPQYKANRPPVDPDLKRQIPYALQLCQALGYPIAHAEGFEADDVIATITRQALGQGWSVRIVSKDKDLAQLLDLQGDVAQVMLEGQKETLYLDRLNCQEKYGVSARLIRDWLALMGDSSDNIIGLRGVGPKTAAALLNRCGSLEALLQNPASAGRFAQALQENRAQLELNRCLTSLDHEAPLPWKLESLETFTINPPTEIPTLFASLGFKL